MLIRELCPKGLFTRLYRAFFRKIVTSLAVRETLVMKKGWYILFISSSSKFFGQTKSNYYPGGEINEPERESFLKFKFQSCLNYRIPFIHFESSYSFLLRASRTESHQNQRPQSPRFVSESESHESPGPRSSGESDQDLVVIGERSTLFVLGEGDYKCTYAFCVGSFIVLLLKSRQIVEKC